jgi:hypothetical protein
LTTGRRRIPADRLHRPVEQSAGAAAHEVTAPRAVRRAAQTAPLGGRVDDPHVADSALPRHRRLGRHHGPRKRCDDLGDLEASRRRPAVRQPRQAVAIDAGAAATSSASAGPIDSQTRSPP